MSIFVNALLGGKRYETLSARSYHDWVRGKPNLVWLIDKTLGQDHCSECYMEFMRTQIGRSKNET